jgi:serine/threonine protein kinase
MSQGTIEHPRRESSALPSDITSDIDSNSAAVEFPTSIAEVLVRSPAEFGLSSSKSSQSSFQGELDKTQFFVDLHRSNPEACHRLAAAVTVLPEVGTELLGFRLLAELGHGAFGRVFLAKQGDLADRLVVLKVSPILDDEPRTLAKLQHTNIMPVHSVHRAGPLQAVCMPYFGATTLASVLRELDGRKTMPESGKELISTIIARTATVQDPVGNSQSAGRSSSPSADCPLPPSNCQLPTANCQPPGAVSAPNLERLQKFSYVEAVLWLGSGLADGLAHAHEHGIVHRDLKPANVLLTDDGQPMLLDFNLAQDTKLGNAAASIQVGGTLPFMAPEQIAAFRNEVPLLDFRGDVYSLGVILFQMLTGRQPFPTRLGPVQEVLEKMTQDRMQPPPGVRQWNKAVTPAVEAIIRKCLEPEPNRRYQNARQLKEDLDRHLENLPLRHASEPSLVERAAKWKRRHPRLASTTTITLLAGAVIAGLLSIGLYREQRLADSDARASLSTFLDGKKTVQYLLTARTDDPAQIEKGIDLGRELLTSYSVLDNPSWQDQKPIRRLSATEQDRLSKTAADLLLLSARGLSLQALNQSEPSARQALIREALRFNELAEACSVERGSRALLAQRAELLSLLGQEEDAKKLQAKALTIPLKNGADQYLVAAEYTAKGRYSEAIPLLTEVT